MSKKSSIVGLDGRPLTIMNASPGTPYESAGMGRRLAGMFAPGSGPNAALVGSLTTLRNRSRAGYRNNPWIKHGTNRLVSNEIGTGITPRSRAADVEQRAPINAVWNAFADECDADGNLNFYGLQALASRTRNVAGEVFIRRRFRRAEDGYTVPMQIQMLEPEFCPESLNQLAPNGNKIKAGIEFDGRGKRVAYWMYREHPQDGSYSSLGELVRVPAQDVIHHYIPLRPGQLRGEPVTAQALLKAYTFDSYDDAELKRKESKAGFTGFIKRPDMETEDEWLYDPLTGDPVNPDADGINNINIQSGTFIAGLPGEEPILFDGDNTGSGYADFMRQQLLGLATGLEGIPYEILSGDWSKVNDRLVRAILHEFRRGIEAVQDHITIHQICRTVWHWAMDAAVMAGALRVPNYASNRAAYVAHEWRPQGWPYLQPETDINAKLKAVEGGLTSLDAEVAKTGYDLEDIQDQNIAAEQRMVEKRRAAGLPDYPPKKGEAPPTPSPNEDPNQPA